MSNTVEATYRTAGGLKLQVTSDNTTLGGDYELYYWCCPGCKTEAPYSHSGERQDYLDSAQAHAEKCAAI